MDGWPSTKVLYCMAFLLQGINCQSAIDPTVECGIQTTSSEFLLPERLLSVTGI